MCLFKEATLMILCICERPANPGIEGSCEWHDELVKHLSSVCQKLRDLAPGFPFWDVHVGFKSLVITVHLQILLERTLWISLIEHYLHVQYIRLHYVQRSEFCCSVLAVLSFLAWLYLFIKKRLLNVFLDTITILIVLLLVLLIKQCQT